MIEMLKRHGQTMPDNDLQQTEQSIVVTGLTRTFGKKAALKNVDISVSRGRVFGLVGENGAGKTTLIKHLVGSLNAQQGSVRVFGLDPVKNPKAVLGRIGYLSEDRDLPHWMRIDELMLYTKAFYPGWDVSYAEKLREMFRLDSSAKVKALSQGQRAKAALLTALAYRPPLLLLDEPSSGLDPVVRRDIVDAVIRTAADEGGTVLFSSHLLDEVERVADDVAMIHEGEIVMSAPLEDIRACHHCITLRFSETPPSRPDLPGALSIEGEDREWTALCEGELGELLAAAKAMGCEISEEPPPTLEDIFVARAGIDRAALRED
jgi:ABC-2 type transport system ATP-binding protein